MSKRGKKVADADKLKEEESLLERKFKWTWKTNGTLIYGTTDQIKSSKDIIAVDMDDTLVIPKSGKTHPINANDWKLWHDSWPAKIKEYHAKDYKFVIITNQGGIEKGHTKPNDIKSKIEQISELIGVPTQAFIASSYDIYRKPCTGMWDFLIEQMNEGVQHDLDTSIYVGDAAGREAGGGKKKKDHSAVDYKFALNIGCQFFTPESFILKQQEVLPTFSFNPGTIKKTGSIFKGEEDNKDLQITSEKQEMIIFVGSPGSGKSTLRSTYLRDYVHVNNDTLKTKVKCYQVATDAMKNGKNVVIDNTNPEKETREGYINLAKEHGYSVRCFYFDYPKDMSFHLNTLRKVNNFRTHNSKAVSDKSEGFSEVKVIELVGGPFKNKQEEKLFFQYVN